MEKRSYQATIELHAEAESRKIVGYAAVFNSLSQDLGGFKEIILPDAFNRSLKKNIVQALDNHDPKSILGRSDEGTLTLVVDEHGLRVEITPSDTSYARDLFANIEHRNYAGMSFGFVAAKDSWGVQGEQVVRTLKEINLFEVSPCIEPAYSDTEVALRSMNQWRNESLLIPRLRLQLAAIE